MARPTRPAPARVHPDGAAPRRQAASPAAPASRARPRAIAVEAVIVARTTIELGIARLFAAKGATVNLTDVDVENGERVARESGGPAQFPRPGLLRVVVQLMSRVAQAGTRSRVAGTAHSWDCTS